MVKQCYDAIADIGDYVSYDPETGDFMWTKRSGSWCVPGVPIRSAERRGYLRVRFRRQSIKLHRLAFYLMTGDWPDGFVDHINGITDDNRWCNLRVVTARENRQNQHALMQTNTSGHVGVGWCNQKRKWFAKIHVDRKQIYLGFFTDKMDAVAAREAARPIYHPAFVP